MLSERLLRRLALIVLLIYAALSAYTSTAHLLSLPQIEKPVMPLLTLLAFAFALIHARVRLGCPRTLLLFCLNFGISLLYESVGVATGWVYRPYHYTDLLGPRFLGLVPYLIPVAWFMMIYPAQVIAEGLLGDGLATGRRKVLGLSAATSMLMSMPRRLPACDEPGLTSFDICIHMRMVPHTNYVCHGEARQAAVA